VARARIGAAEGVPGSHLRPYRRHVVATVDEYLAGLPAVVRDRVDQLRAVIREVVPDVEETISYAMPTFVLDGQPLLHLAAWKHHIGIYPLPALDPALAAEVAPHRGTRDTLTLLHDRPLPRELVGRVVAAMVAQRG